MEDGGVYMTAVDSWQNQFSQMADFSRLVTS